MTDTLKVNELFSGIGAFRKALIRLGIPHDIVGISEIDKYAITSYEAIYGGTRNYGDISQVSKLDYADLWTYGFPCQDISVAGKQSGIVKGQTRSGLLYEVQRLLSTSAECGELPKYLILENVKNLVGKKFKTQFLEWVQWLDDLGYTTYWQVINAVDCNIPQSRERVFAVSVRKDIDSGFKFPENIPLERTLEDMCEEEVDEKYYINKELSDKLVSQLRNKTISNTVRGGESLNRPKCKINIVGRILPPSGKIHQSQEVYDPQGVIGTIKACSYKDPPKIIERKSERVRKLTPKECWRLMGFDDEDFAKAANVCSQTQLYKQAGNSIVVNCLEGILQNLLPKPVQTVESTGIQQISMFR